MRSLSFLNFFFSGLYHHFGFITCNFDSISISVVGLTYMVYPGAVHSRFEHSLGVYWLASDAVNRLRTCQVGLYPNGIIYIIPIFDKIFLMDMPWL